MALIELVVTTLLLFQNDKNDDFCLKPPPSFSDDVILFTMFWDGVPYICKTGGRAWSVTFFFTVFRKINVFS